jgi:hypothetical protein
MLPDAGDGLADYLTGLPRPFHLTRVPAADRTPPGQRSEN